MADTAPATGHDLSNQILSAAIFPVPDIASIFQTMNEVQLNFRQKLINTDATAISPSNSSRTASSTLSTDDDVTDQVTNVPVATKEQNGYANELSENFEEYF